MEIASLQEIAVELPLLKSAEGREKFLGAVGALTQIDIGLGCRGDPYVVAQGGEHLLDNPTRISEKNH